MNQHTEITLEFDKIRERLSDFALSDGARERIAALTPFSKESDCRRAQEETTAARQILDAWGSPPVSSMREAAKARALCLAGSMLLPEQLEAVEAFLASCKRMKAYLARAEQGDSRIAPYGRTLDELPELREEIGRCIRSSRVDSGASPALRDIRRRIDTAETEVKSRLESILRSKKAWFSDGYYSVRDGHYVLPVKKEFRRQFDGTLIASSSTGGTCFMEPAPVSRLQAELSGLRIEEDSEVRRILYALTAMVEKAEPVLRLNTEAMETLDFLFAKAKLSASMDARPVQTGLERRISIVQGRHPLLFRESCVPLDFQLDAATRGAVITGPNTGGKTVALKTVGLLSLMAQCGLHVPAAEDSYFAMHADYCCDIGDGQSISENLSTFSAHIRTIIGILSTAGPESLVLLDELGSGTDPAEGMGIAVAVLEELRNRNCLFLVTTHYPEVKEFAAQAEGMVNARMAFDRETLQPLYRLEQGQAGESCALYIAHRLGMPPRILNRAREEAARAGTGAVSLPDAFQENVPEKTPSPYPKLTPQAAPKPVSARAAGFQIGDSVLVYPERDTGIIFQTADHRGVLGVQVKGRKKWINHKRVKLQIPASELYPEGYDFSILFDTVENRKARHKMEKGHQPGLQISYDGSQNP